MPTAIDKLLILVKDYDATCSDGYKAPGEWIVNYNKTLVHMIGIPQKVSTSFLISKDYGFIEWLVREGYIVKHRLMMFGKIAEVQYETGVEQRVNKFDDVHCTITQIQTAYTPIAELLYLLGLKD